MTSTLADLDNEIDNPTTTPTATRQGGLILPEDVGRTFTGAAPVGRVSGGSLAEIDTAISLASKPSRFLPVPNDNPRDGALKLLDQLANGEDANPASISSIMASVNATATSPEVAYILSHPDIVDTWQSAWWTNVMKALSVSAVGDNQVGGADRERLVSFDMMATFFKKYESKFSADERKFLINTLAALPDAVEIMQAEGVKLHTSDGGFWSDQWTKLKNSYQVISKAPQAIRPIVNDPRGQMIFLMDEYLKNNSLDTIEDRSNFALFVSERTTEHVAEVGALSEGFFRILQQTVGWVPDVTLNKFNDVLVKAADPGGYETRQFGSIGMNVALAMGVDPGEAHYNTLSGGWDAFAQIFLDPQNFIFNAGSAIKAAGKIPRTVSKAQAIGYAFHPLGGSKLGLSGWDSSIVGRFTYAFLSRDVDQLVKTPQGIETTKWLTKTGSAGQITRKFPTIPEKLANQLAASNTFEATQELLRAALNGAAALGEDAPLLASKTAAILNNKMATYLASRTDYFDPKTRKADLNSLNPMRDNYNPDTDVFTIGADEGIVKNIADRIDVPDTRQVATMKDNAGTKFSVHEVPGSDEGFVVRNKDGDFVGGFTGGKDGNLTVVDAERGTGLAQEVMLMAQRVSGGLNPQSITGPARKAAGIPVVYDAAQLTGDGARKVVFTSPRHTSSIVDLADGSAQSRKFLEDMKATKKPILMRVADTLDQGVHLGSLSPEDITALSKYANDNQIHMIRNGDGLLRHSLITPLGERRLVDGFDGGADAVKFADDRPAVIGDLARAHADQTDITEKANTRQYVLKDLPVKTIGKDIKAFGESVGKVIPDQYLRGMRRFGFQFSHKLPTNISLVEGARGARELSDWIRALGSSPQKADKWASEFLAAGVGERKGIIQKALKDVGEDIDNPLLRYGLIDFGEKQGQYTFFFDHTGNEIGAGLDDSITAMMQAHFVDNFAMPDAKELIRSIRRFKDTRLNMPFMNRGIIQGTKDNRKFLAANLKSKMRANHGDVVDELSKNDFLAMAYADVVGAGNRVTGLGAINTISRYAAKPVQMLHHVFVIAQLALRAIPWASRVLLEETIRADLMGMPSLWRNPVSFIGDFFEARAVRKLPDRLKNQAAVIDGLISDLFVKGGGVNLEKIADRVPGVVAEMRAAGINMKDVSEVRAFVGNKLGKGLLGGDAATTASLGLRGNGTRRVLLRERKIRNTYAKLDERGLTANFRWNIDGEDIANRSFYSSWQKELEAGSVPMEWSATAMTADGLKTYGRGYGRQIYYMFRNDPIIREFGIGRALDAAGGVDTTMDARALIQRSSWERVKPNIIKKWEADGRAIPSDVELAEWYLTDIVDEVVYTLIDPLAKNANDIGERARILEGLKAGRVEVEMNDVVHVLEMRPDNYEGFVDKMGQVVTSAYHENVLMPPKMSVYFDPRFGQRTDEISTYRRFTDWTMQVMGERTTQALSRQPAYLAVHEKWFKHYKELGWSVDDARAAAHEQAVTMVNWVFFNNSDIPQFLHDFNKVVPFFSAMFEVSQTWFYKIPSQNMLPIGYAHLGRRVDRVLNGLMATGIVSYDEESNRMTVRLSADMENANDPVTSVVGKGMFNLIRAPITAAEHIVGLGRLLAEPFNADGVEVEGYNPADFSAWTRDGFELTIGNPLDPSSTGIMAVNQFSLGFTPALQWPVSVLATGAFGADTQLEDTVGTLGDYALENPEADINLILHQNREAFIAANSPEEFDRALFDFGFNIEDLNMPDHIELPQTSTWETLVDRMFFPFGQIETFGQALTSVSPSALNYVWRGLMTKFGWDASEMSAWWFGQMSNYQVSSEISYSLQHLEATEGLVTNALSIAAEIEALVEGTIIEIAKDSSGAGIVLDPTAPGSEEVQAKLTELDRLNTTIMKRALDNAAGSLLMRGTLGEMLPATPRMWDRQQEAVEAYWGTRDVAQEARVRGSVDFAELLQVRDINTAKDLAQVAGLVENWLQDPSGDATKVWVQENHPGMMPFIQGKTYWGPGGPPPEAQGFDDWVEQLEREDRKPFAPEVFMYRMMAAAANVDKEIAIIDQYGNDPDVAVSAILDDWNGYQELTDGPNMKLKALDFIDAHVFEGKYAAWQEREGLDSLSTFSLVKEKLEDTRQEIDNIMTLLEYSDLDPDEERKVRGYLNTTIRTVEGAILDLRDQAADDITFQNPLEQNIASYFLEVATPYWDGRNDIFSLLDEAETSVDRSFVFDLVRLHDNAHFTTPYSIESSVGKGRLAVPNEIVRAWNGRDQAERQERILKMIGKKPEWMNLFEANVLAAEEPDMHFRLPTTMQQLEIYDETSLRKLEIREFARLNPQQMSASQRDKQIGAWDDALEEWLVANGRGAEVEYRRAMPIVRLEMAGLLPPSVEGLMPYVNQVYEQLRAIDKSPLTEQGRVGFLQLIDWLNGDYYIRHPQAKEDMAELGLVMFDESFLSATYQRLLRGSTFGSLE